jgi:hypothetical protein
MKKLYVETRGRHILYDLRFLALKGDSITFPVPADRKPRHIQVAIITAARRAGVRVHTSVQGEAVQVVRIK